MSSDRWALQAFQGPQSVGIYAVLYQLGYVPMSMLSSLVIKLVVAVISSRSGGATDPDRVKDAYHAHPGGRRGDAAADKPRVSAGLRLRGPIFALFVGPFRASSAYFPLLVFAGGIFGAGQGAALILMSGTYTRLLMLPKITTAIVGVLSMWGGAYWLGIPRVVFANGFFGLVYFVWIMVLGRKFERTARFPNPREIHAARYRYST